MGTVQWVPSTIGVTITFMIHSFFISRAKSWYVSSFTFIFILWSTETTQSPRWQVLLVLFIKNRPGFLVRIGWSVLIVLVFWSRLGDPFYKVWSSGQYRVIHLPRMGFLVGIGWFVLNGLVVCSGSWDLFYKVWSSGRDWVMHLRDWVIRFSCSGVLVEIGWSFFYVWSGLVYIYIYIF